MNINQLLTVIVSLVLINLTFSNIALAQDQSALSPEQHPNSPSYQSGFPPKIIPLDTKLSWTKRFNGNEVFNENEVLEQVATTIAPTARSIKENDQHAANHQMNIDGTGVIKQIKTNQGKIKLKHGPIERLGMPAMTMVFKVDDTSQLDGLEKEQEIGFSVDNSSGGFVITQIMAMKGGDAAMSAMPKSNAISPMDATGTVKAIRPKQGKLKVEHGPIDRLGMPAMTMMFKVADPESLKGLKKGDAINFSVDNSAGGFVITDLQSAQ